MNLYERDYTLVLTDEEKEALKQETEYANRPGIKSNRGFRRFSHPDKSVRDFLWHKRSMFPNNYLHFRKFQDLNFDEESAKFSDILSESTSEQDFQRYIKENKKWFIPGSIFLDYNFGHHDAYLFPEQKLGTDYIADYMMIGKNSDGYSIVLVEFEDANTDFILKSSKEACKRIDCGIWKRIHENKFVSFLFVLQNVS